MHTVTNIMDPAGVPRAAGNIALGLGAESVLDASPNPVVAVDGRGRIVYANPRVQEAFGWSPEELRGEPIERLVPSRLTERHAALRAEYRRYGLRDRQIQGYRAVAFASMNRRSRLGNTERPRL